MTTKELEMAIDRAQWVARKLSEAHAFRWHGDARKADVSEKSARRSLEELAMWMGLVPEEV